MNEDELASQVSLLQSENQRWKMYTTSLHSDIYGSRLAAKYLEKELAGRIQQMQLLGKLPKEEPRVLESGEVVTVVADKGYGFIRYR